VFVDQFASWLVRPRQHTEDFQVNNKLRKQLRARKRRIKKRLQTAASGRQSPELQATNVQYEISERQQAVACGGIGLIHQMVNRLGLAEQINRGVPLFKLYLPYAESDHVLNIAYNILAGGTCLEHLEYRRNDEVYLNALGATRIPDPTTAGDFCRRFDARSIDQLQEVFNETRVKVWKQQPDEFFEEACIDGDGTMVTTTGECKEGMDINHKNEWGYHPLIVSLANTGEPLYLLNRSGNRPSHEGAAEYFDRAVNLCRNAGFRNIRLRGDTDFSQTTHLDRWDDDEVDFVFGIDAMPNLYEIAENLPQNAWEELTRPSRYEVKTKPRRRPPNVKQSIVEQREYNDVRLAVEHIAEFAYRPSACDRDYRVVVIWKSLEVYQGQTHLFDDAKAFFYITNDWQTPAADIVTRHANQRCHQENLIEQHKNGVHSLKAPLDSLESNWAYMVISSLAWSLKAWSALLVPVTGRDKRPCEQAKRKLLRMEFPTYCQAMINIPAQIIRSGRRLIYRLLSWNRWQEVFFRLWHRLQQPLRC
jgi:hypothetical protein